MAKTFDATLNILVDDHVPNWTGYLAGRCGIPPGPPCVLDTDLSATLQADRLFRIDGAAPAIIHLELESTGRLGIPNELMRYNVAARAANDLLPVHSVIMVLRPKANATDLTGQLDVAGADGTHYLTFRYTVIRIWQEPLDALLAAGPGVAPLALLTNEAAADLPRAFERFRQQLRASGVQDNVERSLLGSTFLLCGLRYPVNQIEALYRELSMTLEDSTTYQHLLARGRTEGRAEGLAEGLAAGEQRGEQRAVLVFGGQRFGVASPAIEAAIRGITDRERLERIMARLSSASGWDDLLATP